MPRLSLYRPEKGQDYKYIDKAISEMFQVGGTDVFYHKYIGTQSVDANGNVVTKDQTQVQDVMFLENRDRKYDTTVYTIRGIYNVQDLDFNLSQFGLFIDNDTLFMTIHINDIISLIGRKPLSGDVVELPHLRDEFPVGLSDVALPRFFEITDIGRAAEGFSRTWYPHLYRLKLHKITGSQQFADILNKAALDANGDPTANTLANLLSTQDKYLQINDAILSEAEADAPKSGYETQQFYTLEVDDQGRPLLRTADETDLTADTTHLDTSEVAKNPSRSGYTGYLLGDGIPDNGSAFGSGIQYPANPLEGDFYLRTDYLPNRLFRYTGKHWTKYEDNVRMTLSNTDTRQTQKTSFINNTDLVYSKQVATGFSHNPTPIPGNPAGYIVAGTTVVDTMIDYASVANGMYIVLKQEAIEISFKKEVVTVPANPVTDYANIVSNNGGKVRITLPVINGVRNTIPYDGVWTITFYSRKDEQRQSLSKALKPKADF